MNAIEGWLNRHSPWWPYVAVAAAYLAGILVAIWVLAVYIRWVVA